MITQSDFAILSALLIAAAIIATFTAVIFISSRVATKRAEELEKRQQPRFDAVAAQVPTAEHITNLTFFELGKYTTVESLDEKGYPQKRMLVVDALVLPNGEKIEYLRLVKLPPES